MKHLIYLLLFTLILSCSKKEQEKPREKALDTKTTIIKLYADSYSYYEKGDFDKSDSCLLEVLALDSSEINAYLGLSGTYFYIRNEQEKSLAFQKKALQYDKKSPIIHNNIGYFFLKTNQLDSAEYYLNKTLSLVPNQPHALSNLGLVYTQKGDFDRAKTFLKKAVQTEQDNPYALKHLALYYIKIKKKDKACQCLKAIDMEAYKAWAPITEDSDIDSLLTTHCSKT